MVVAWMSESVSRAKKSLAEKEAESAARATRDATEPTPWSGPSTAMPSDGTRSFIPISVGDGFEHGDSEPAANLEPSTASSTSTSSTPSKTSGQHSRNSKHHWRVPGDAMGFASQMRAVATMVLNEEIDLDIARTYGALARATVQALSVSVTRSRFSREVPDLDFITDLFDELDAGDEEAEERQTPPSETEADAV